MAQAVVAVHAHEDEKQKQLSIANQKLAMWLYLASEVVIFSILIGGYAIFRVNHPENVHAVHEKAGLTLVSINTFLLLTSSWAMVMGLREIQRKNRQGFLQWFGLMTILGIVFIGLQWYEYKELAHLSITLGQTLDPVAIAAYGDFGSRFYTPTAFHGAHVIVGVLWGLLVMWRGYQGRYDDNPVGVEVFGLYWHFVDVVWIILFTLIYLV
jgi:heme/copper-type cytochrome/quinol oxidase subunit 3